MTLPDPIQEEVLDRMQVLWPRYNQPECDQRLALKDYREALEGFSREELRDGWRATVKTHEFNSRPTPAEIVKNCERAASLRRVKAIADTEWDGLAGTIKRVTGDYFGPYFALAEYQPPLTIVVANRALENAVSRRFGFALEKAVPGLTIVARTTGR